MKTLCKTDYFEIYKKWMQGVGPFRCYYRSLNFVSLKHYPDFTFGEVSFDKTNVFTKLCKIIDQHAMDKPLIVLDIPGKEAINTAFLLQQHRQIKPILTFNSPMHPFGLVGSQEYISALLKYGEALIDINPIGFAFILDNDRYGDYTDQDLRSHFNNQYELIDEDLPSLEMLKELGFDKLLYISDRSIKEDIKNYLVYLTEQSFPVIMEEL